MSDNQQLALEYAIDYLKAFYGRSNTYKKLDQHYRSQMLGVADDDFDWRPYLNNASEDFICFDTLKRYCAHQIRMGKSLPDKLRYWIADVMEGIEPTINEPQGGVETGANVNAFLPRLVQILVDKFDLPATRGSGSDPISACDVVERAINCVPEAREIRKRGFESIRKSYARAKRNGAFKKLF